VNRSQVAVAALDGQRVKERAVDDGREPIVVAGEVRDVGADERGVGKAALLSGFGCRGNSGRCDVNADDGVAAFG